MFVSRWDRAVADKVPAELRDKLGIAVAQQAYSAYRELIASERWQRLAYVGARPQRLLFASTSTKDPRSPDTMYVSALAAPNTVNTMPDETLLAFADHGEVGSLLPPTAATTAARCWANSRAPDSTSTRWRGSCRPTAPSRSCRAGRTC